MAITKLRLPPKAETPECIALTHEWLKWNDEEPLWLLKDIFETTFATRSTEQKRLVWAQAMGAYHA